MAQGLVARVLGVLVSGVVATLGLISGYFGGRTDAVIMRLVDISLGLPIILIALVFVAALGPSFTTVIVVTSILLWSRLCPAGTWRDPVDQGV